MKKIQAESGWANELECGFRLRGQGRFPYVADI